MLESVVRMLEDTLGRAALAVFDQPAALFVGLLVGLIVGFLAGTSSGRRIS